MNILFLCVANSARSQIAEGLAKFILPDDVYIQSAGSQPSGRVHPLAIEVMQEIGIDISGHQSKGINDLPKEFLKNLDLVVTLCAEEHCPSWPGKFRKESWGLPDPVSSSASVDEEKKSFRDTRNKIQEKIEKLRADLST